MSCSNCRPIAPTRLPLRPRMIDLFDDDTDAVDEDDGEFVAACVVGRADWKYGEDDADDGEVFGDETDLDLGLVSAIREMFDLKYSVAGLAMGDLGGFGGGAGGGEVIEMTSVSDNVLLCSPRPC